MLTKREVKECWKEMQALTEVQFIDVRTPGEFNAVHASQTRNIPLADIAPAGAIESTLRREIPTYIICQRGGRADQACAMLLNAGFSNVISVQGGTEAWLREGLPCVRGRGAISLERQVRIAAGTLVLAGILGALFINWWCLTLSGFVGAGLVYSGISDTCGMGLILARCPWNRSAPQSCSSPAYDRA